MRNRYIESYNCYFCTPEAEVEGVLTGPLPVVMVECSSVRCMRCKAEVSAPTFLERQCVVGGGFYTPKPEYAVRCDSRNC